MVEISTSLLSINQENSVKTLYNLEVAKTDYFHIDVMDGKFVKNNTISLMQEYCNQIKQISNIPLDIHLMVQDIKTYIHSYLPFEPNIITFHLEACKEKEEVEKLIQYIKENHVKVGLAISPSTNIEELYDYLPYIHNVLIMTVEPGYGGQKLIPETVNKVKQLKQYIQKKQIELDIEVDGGIQLENINQLKEAGANIIVAGTAIISAKDYYQTIKKMKETIEK